MSPQKALGSPLPAAVVQGQETLARVECATLEGAITEIPVRNSYKEIVEGDFCVPQEEVGPSMVAT